MHKLRNITDNRWEDRNRKGLKAMSQYFTHLITYKSHSNPQKLCLLLLQKLTPRLDSLSILLKPKNWKQPGIIRGTAPSHYSASHPHYHWLHYFKCSLLLVAHRFSEPEAVHHGKIWDTWKVYLSFGKWEEIWIKGRLTSKKAYIKTDLKTDNLRLLIRLLLLGEKTLWPEITAALLYIVLF